jgi:hypothetical protein
MRAGGDRQLAMTGARLLTYYSAARLSSLLHIPHAVMNRMFPSEFALLHVVSTSEFVE